jgi:glutamyl-tRNA reductase
MHITLVGISHKTAAVAVRERFAFSAEELPNALPRFGGAAVLLSTCNRTEVYLASHHPITAGSVIALLRELKDGGDVPDEAFYHLAGKDAARHLFRVAAGIESMVLGEAEILGQVRGAFSAATQAGTHNAVLSQLFHEAIRVGRRARSETHIGRNAVSVSSTAVALAKRTLGGLESRTVLVVSAGETGKLTARSLAKNGASRLLVVNRRRERARELAAELGGEAVSFDKLGSTMGEADIVISSSSASEFLISADHVRQALASRNGRPLLLIDIAVPRDIDPSVRDLPQVYLYDIDDLQAAVEEGRSLRQQQVAPVERIVDAGVSRFGEWLRERGVVPTVAALRERADGVREAEVERTLRKLPELTAKERTAVEAMANALVKKLLHDPIDRLKGPDGERYVGTLRELFALDGAVSPNGTNED